MASLRFAQDCLSAVRIHITFATGTQQPYCVRAVGTDDSVRRSLPSSSFFGVVFLTETDESVVLVRAAI